MPMDEYDWIFDYVLQFLESDKFDAEVMDFMDEKCEAFDNEDENKLVYTVIHKEFREHLEALISSYLVDFGISSEIFFEACERGRNNRDINRIVFERMIAMEDFQTFKKLMVKRNTELQIEAMRSYRQLCRSPNRSSKNPRNSDDSDLDNSTMDIQNSLPDPDDLNAVKEAELEELARQETILEEEMHALLQESLMDMELLHRQEALEQAELEQALALSLAIEEERLSLLRSEVKATISESNDSKNSQSFVVESDDKHSDAKASPVISGTQSPPAAASSAAVAVESSAKDSEPSEEKRSIPRRLQPTNTTNEPTSSFPDPKPLKLRGELKPLPSINANSLQTLNSDFEERRNAAKEAFKKNQDALQQQRKIEEDAKKQLNIKPDDAEERARHMREQRDRIIAMKKAEREKKVREEEASRRKQESGEAIADAVKQAAQDLDAKGTGNSNNNDQEEQKQAMRMALAKRLKMDIINGGGDQGNATNLSKLQEDQFGDLDRQLKQVERLREENRQREAILAAQLKKQQETLARKAV